eukprot:2761664-Pyramimonas_sp.AAC.1
MEMMGAGDRDECVDDGQENSTRMLVLPEVGGCGRRLSSTRPVGRIIVAAQETLQRTGQISPPRRF